MLDFFLNVFLYGVVFYLFFRQFHFFVISCCAKASRPSSFLCLHSKEPDLMLLHIGCVTNIFCHLCIM